MYKIAALFLTEHPLASHTEAQLHFQLALSFLLSRPPTIPTPMDLQNETHCNPIPKQYNSIYPVTVTNIQQRCYTTFSSTSLKDDVANSCKYIQSQTNATTLSLNWLPIDITNYSSSLPPTASFSNLLLALHPNSSIDYGSYNPPIPHRWR